MLDVGLGAMLARRSARSLTSMPYPLRSKLHQVTVDMLMLLSFTRVGFHSRQELTTDWLPPACTALAA